MYDVIIIGAGIVGSSIAREISKYNLKTHFPFFHRQF